MVDFGVAASWILNVVIGRRWFVGKMKTVFQKISDLWISKSMLDIGPELENRFFRICGAL
jgi:hypothetical protein